MDADIYLLTIAWRAIKSVALFNNPRESSAYVCILRGGGEKVELSDE